MSDFDDDDFQPRRSDPTGVWTLAALSSAVFLCSVLGAKVLSHMVDEGDLPTLAFKNDLRHVAKTAPTPSAPEVYSIVRSVGVDGMTTATIPLSGSRPVSPCGDVKK